MPSYCQDVSLRDGVTIIRPNFKFTIGISDKLGISLEEALQAGAKKIVVDMSRIGAIDASGQGEMLSACLHCANWKAILVFAAALPGVQDAFGLVSPLIIYSETVDEAVAAIKNKDFPTFELEWHRKRSKLTVEPLKAKKRRIRPLHQTAGTAGEE